MTTAPSPVHLRPGRPDDAPALYAMHVQALGARSRDLTVYADPRAVTWLAERLAEPLPCLAVAEAEGRVLGYIDTVAAGDAFHFNYMVVHPDARGRGIGNALFGLAERWGIERGFRTLSTDVFAVDTTIIQRYQRLGYAIVRRAVHVRLSIPPVASRQPRFTLPPDGYAAALQAVSHRGFGRFTATCGDDTLDVGLMGDDTCRLLDRGALTVEEAVAEVRALLAGQRSLLVVLALEHPPACDGIVALDETVRMQKPVTGPA